METSIILGLLQNIGILVAFALVYEITWLKSDAPKTLTAKLLSGIIIGGIGVVLMFSPWTLMPGITFDTRSIMLAVSGLFFGFIPTLVAMLITAGVRLWMGGGGVWMGVAVIFSSGTIGVLWKQYRHLLAFKNKYIELLLLGLVVHLVMLGWSLLLPVAVSWTTVKTIFLPLIIIYTPGTMFLGILMMNQTRNVQNRFALEKVNELERRLSQIMRSGNIVSLILDADARILFCNKYLTDLTGYTEQEVLQRDWLHVFLPPEVRKEVESIFRKSIKGDGFVEVYENEIIGKSGDRFFISWHNTRLFDEKNRMIGVACLGVNLSQRKLMEQQLYDSNLKLEEKNSQYKALNQELLVAKTKAEESDRLKSAFLANLSHEIRTPMNAILGFTDLLRIPDLEVSEKEGYINVVHKSGRHLLSIINDIIEMSRIEAGFVELGSNKISIKGLMHDLYQTLKVTIPEEKKVTLELEKSIPELNISVDEVKLKQVLINLLSNAIKYTEKGSVTFGCEVEKMNELHFWVQDTGIGIEKKYHELIFNRFRQVDEELKFARGGFGLGLSISKAYVEMMGGKLSLNSELGIGSRFSFFIPLTEAESRAEQLAVIEDLPAAQSRQDTRMHILIAEDDQDNSYYLKALFKKRKYPVIYVTNGLQAVEVCNNNPEVGLVLMDIKMPVMDGYMALIEIRKIKPDLKVIAQTAYALEEDEVKITEAGFDGYLTKPINKELLFRVVDQYLC